MKILVVCQYYFPEPFRINDWCEELVKRGHEVQVVTGTPNYPMGEIYDGYQNGKRSDEVINGVAVHRCPIVGRKNGAIHRFINYYDFVLKSKKYVSTLDNSFDVVLVNQLSPVMMAEAGVQYKKKYKKKLILYCLDLWPESLVVGGIRPNSIIYKIFLSISRKIYTQADVILNTSKLFEEYFSEKFTIKNTKYVPQYAEELFTPDSCRKEFDGKIDLLFAGNVGAAQSVNTIIEAARLTMDNLNIMWHIVGDGTELEKLKQQAKDLSNVRFYGRLPLELMPSMYSKADALIVTMENNPIISLTLPGKVQSYMAAGKPIIGAIDGETRRIIEEANCGLCCDSENAVLLAQNARALFTCDREKMGENARKYYERYFSKEVFLNSLIQVLHEQ